MDLIQKIKEKKIFSQLPNSIIERALDKSRGDVKVARALLRKYFGVFLTNKILKAKILDEEILKKHLSTKERDYPELYAQIIKNEKSVVDLGAGINGFSYGYFPKNVDYVGIEGVGQLVKLMNDYFKQKCFDALAIQGDLFNLDFVLDILKKQKKPRVVFMFQIVDALEFFGKTFSKEFILKIFKECEKIVLSFAEGSLSGRTKFKIKRKWLEEFIDENFYILDTFSIKKEKFIILSETPHSKLWGI